MTVNFFGMSNRPIGGLNVNQVSDSQKSSKTKSTEEVSFGATLESAQAAQSTNKIDDPERAARVQELKAQVSAGTYEPDLESVSAQLLKFLVER